MVDEDVSCLFLWTNSPSWLAWSGIGGHPELSLHSSNEPGELSQWFAMMPALADPRGEGPWPPSPHGQAPRMH